MAPITTAGKLLIATPAIGDGNFEQSVIAMLHHGPDGALGVIINQPTQLAIDELLPRWTDLSSDPAVIFSGGPVEEDGFIGVGRAVGSGAEANADTIALVDGTAFATVDLQSDPAFAAASVDRLRIFRGYSGWGPQQLDTELAAGAWFTVPMLEDDMWSATPSGLYEEVLLRQRGDMRWYANAPTDPSLN